MAREGKKYKVLVVDDERVILKLIKDFLEAFQYEVKTCDNPKSAYDLIENEPFDVVISDVEMPEMNGLELLRKIKNHNGLIPVIIITGYTTINNIMNAFRYGAYNLFFKPLRMAELKEAVDSSITQLERIKLLLDEVAANR